MVEGMIPIKTPQGQAELSTRQLGISQRHRTVLFLVDGKRTAAEVRSMALKAGVPEVCFDEVLAMGLVMLPERTTLLMVDTPASAPGVLHVDLPLPLPLPIPDSVPAAQDAPAPPPRTPDPQTISTDSTADEMPFPDSWLEPDSGEPAGTLDPAVVEARLILLHAVRTEAPLAGSLTLLRLRRARTRADLNSLLDEVEARITKPHRSLAAGLTMQRVRLLLERGVDPTLAPP